MPIRAENMIEFLLFLKSKLGRALQLFGRRLHEGGWEDFQLCVSDEAWAF
jgi:hypothetical protein